MFDGAGQFPKEAEDIQKQLLAELDERDKKLQIKMASANEGAEKKSFDVGIGKCLEKILPACKGFCTPLAECRPLYEPIDMVLFNEIGRAHV